MPSWPSTPRPNLFQNATFPVTAHQSTSSLLPLGVVSHSPPKRPSSPQFHLYRSHLPSYCHCTTSLTPGSGSAIVWLSGFPAYPGPCCVFPHKSPHSNRYNLSHCPSDRWSHFALHYNPKRWQNWVPRELGGGGAKCGWRQKPSNGCVLWTAGGWRGESSI